MSKASVENRIANINNWDLFPIEKLLTECRVVVHYMSLMVFPAPGRLNLDHDFPLSTSLLEPVSTLFSLVFILLLTGLAVANAKRNKLFFLAVFWFFGNLVIESTIIPLDIIFEHRVYLPSMLFYATILPIGFYQLKTYRTTAVVVCLIICLFSAWTWQRNEVWGDALTLWSDTVQKSPEKARPHNNLGLELANIGRFDEAIRHYQTAIRINPDFYEAHNNLGSALKQGGDLSAAIIHFKKAVALNPDFGEPLINLGIISVRQGNVRQGIRYYQEAIAVTPDNHIAHYNLGNIFLLAGKPDQAIYHYRIMVRIHPDFANGHNNLALALESKGEKAEAVKHYFKAMRIDPGHTDARANLKALLAREGSLEKGIDTFEEVLDITPGDQEAKKRLMKSLP